MPEGEHAMGLDESTLSNHEHPCERADCTAWVGYDDEPYCFTHSPDSGSTVVGYSYKRTHAAKSDAPVFDEEKEFVAAIMVRIRELSAVIKLLESEVEHLKARQTVG